MKTRKKEYQDLPTNKKAKIQEEDDVALLQDPSTQEASDYNEDEDNSYNENDVIFKESLTPAEDDGTGDKFIQELTAQEKSNPTQEGNNPEDDDHDYEYIVKLQESLDTLKKNKKLLQKLREKYKKQKSSTERNQQLKEIQQHINEINQQIDDIEELILNASSCRLYLDDSTEDESELEGAEDGARVAMSMAAASSSSSSSINYAPHRQTVSFTKNLYCINIKWSNNSGENLNTVNSVGKHAANIYNELSDGAVKFNVFAQTVEVNLPRNAKNLAKAVKIIKGKIKAPKGSAFAIFHNQARGYSNAGRLTAYMYGTLLRDLLHELGHAVFKLGHAGKYFLNAQGELMQLKAYNDPDSFMGKFASLLLNAPELYYLGWLGEKQVGQYIFNSPSVEYRIGTLNSKKDDNLQAVQIIPSAGREMFLSFSKGANTLHFRQDGGTQLIKKFGDEFKFGDFVFDTTSQDKTSRTIKISAKPTI